MKGKKILKAIVKGTFSPIGAASIGIESDLGRPVADGTMDGHYKRQRKIILDKLPKEMKKKFKTFKEFQEAAIAIPAGLGLLKTGAKVAGAVLAAKGGEKILKDLLGTPGRPKRTDWDKNPKDKIDQELNVRQGQAKDAAKNKDFDADMKSYRKGKKNLSDEDKIQRLKDAAAKHRKGAKK